MALHESPDPAKPTIRLEIENFDGTDMLQFSEPLTSETIKRVKELCRRVAGWSSTQWVIAGAACSPLYGTKDDGAGLATDAFAERTDGVVRPLEECLGGVVERPEEIVDPVTLADTWFWAALGPPDRTARRSVEAERVIRRVAAARRKRARHRKHQEGER